MTPIGLYVHIPFCRTKCPYCSFNSLPCEIGTPPLEYLAALKIQAGQMASAWAKDQVFGSMFIGGGTPTIYDQGQLADLLAACFRSFNFQRTNQAGPEITMETNPNTVSLARLTGLRAAGVNRLSIGVQSFSDPLLGAIGRSHSAADALRAHGLARAAGFTNINLDLMYGLPGQSLADWRATLATALGLGVEHLALYELTIEEDTRFYTMVEKGLLQLPGEDEILRMEEAAGELLGQNGFIRYEISNYARPGFECRHNINYWENGFYVGLGAGAVSCLGGMRIKNELDPAEFIRMAALGRQPFFESECLALEDRFRETVIMGLRMLAGVSGKILQERFGLNLMEYYGETIEELLRQDLLEMAGDRIRLTRKALPLANQVLSRLV